jgi:hypothetical protein
VGVDDCVGPAVFNFDLHVLSKVRPRARLRWS